MDPASPPLVVPAVASVVPATVVAVVLVGLACRRAGADLTTTLWRTSFVAYLGALVAITFFPFVTGLEPVWQTSWRDSVNLEPLGSAHLRSFWLNIVMTVPLGVFLTGRVVTGRGRLRGVARVTAIALVASVSVELLQLVLHETVGGNRSTDVDDVLANTSGALLGAVLWRLVGLVARLLGVRPSRVGTPPRDVRAQEAVVASRNGPSAPDGWAGAAGVAVRGESSRSVGGATRY